MKTHIQSDDILGLAQVSLSSRVVNEVCEHVACVLQPSYYFLATILSSRHPTFDSVSCVLTASELCAIASKAKNIIIHQSRGLMFLVYFYSNKSFNWLYNLTFSSGLQPQLPRNIVCLRIRYSVSLIEMDGVILMWPSLRFSCMSVRRRELYVVVSEVVGHSAQSRMDGIQISSSRNMKPSHEYACAHLASLSWLHSSPGFLL